MNQPFCPVRISRVDPQPFAVLCLGLLLTLASCSGHPAKSTKELSAIDASAKLKACRPQTATDHADDNLKLVVTSVTNDADATKVQLKIMALKEPADFYFPAYRLSSGRWLINGRGRAYLIDESCREFKLKDRKAVSEAQGIPPDGKVRLQPAQEFEGVLIFPRLFDDTQVALLVYDDLILPIMTKP